MTSTVSPRLIRTLFAVMAIAPPEPTKRSSQIPCPAAHAPPDQKSWSPAGSSAYQPRQQRSRRTQCTCRLSDRRTSSPAPPRLARPRPSSPFRRGSLPSLSRQSCHQRPHTVALNPVSYTHLRAHETKANLVCRLLLEKKKKTKKKEP